MVIDMKLLLFILLVLTLGIQDGNLCLKSDGNPVQNYGISAELFPESDRAALEDGIGVSSGEALQGLLEDYLS